MAKRRTTKGESTAQEDHVAKTYSGQRVRGSGAVANHPGDVRNETTLFECKTTGDTTKPAKSISLNLAVFEKIADEAWSVGLEPALALRMYNPQSVLADRQGYVDVIVRLMRDDAERNDVKIPT